LLAVAIAIGAPLGWLLSSRDGQRDAAEPSPSAAAAPSPASVRATRPAPTATSTAAAPVPAAATPPAALPRAVAGLDPVAGPHEGDLTPDLSDYLNRGETPTMAEVIARLHAAGVTSGLGAFQPPGTRPPLVGLAVPDDFELPPGYVRHYQTTDDGQRLEPILMFSPDTPWYDAAGQRLQLPAHRVVPMEMAPPGLPIRRIVVPAPPAPGK
jgi:hypothetical protein